MAFVQSPIDPSQQNQLGPQGQTTPNPLALLPPQATQTGGSSGQGGGAQAQTAPGVGSPTQFGTSASKLSDYLNANQDQVQQMANQIAGQMGQNYTNLQQGVNQAAQGFNPTIGAGYTPQDPTLNAEVASNPTQAASNPQQVSEFQSMLNDQYTGPTSFEGSTPYANVQQQVNNAIQQANLLGTYPGLSQYLQNNIEVNPTQGQNTLDTTLLQANPNAVQTIQQAGAPFAGLTDYLNNAAATQDAAIQAAQQAAPAAQQAAVSAFDTGVGNLNANVNQELAQAEQGYTGAQTGLNNYIAALQKPGVSGLTVQQMQQLGIDPTIIAQYTGAPTVESEMQGAWNGLPTLQPLAPGSNDFTFPTIGAGPSAATVATPQDYATLAALQSLGGTSNPFSSPIASANAGEAGSYQTPNAAPTPNNQALGQALYNELNAWANPTGITPVGGPGQPGQQQEAESDYATMMNTLASYLGLSAFNPSYPTQSPPPTGGGGGGGGTGGLPGFPGMV